MDESLYTEYLTYKIQYPTITFEEFVSMKEYCENMIKEEIEYMISSAVKGEEYNPPAGKTPFDDWARKMTREFAVEYVEKIKGGIFGMNSRWRQKVKILKQWNNEIQKSFGNKHKCLSKTERKRIKEGTRYLSKFKIEFDFEEVE